MQSEAGLGLALKKPCGSPWHPACSTPSHSRSKTRSLHQGVPVVCGRHPQCKEILKGWGSFFVRHTLSRCVPLYTSMYCTSEYLRPYRKYFEATKYLWLRYDLTSNMGVVASEIQSSRASLILWDIHPEIVYAFAFLKVTVYQQGVIWRQKSIFSPIGVTLCKLQRQKEKVQVPR
jgi:hypothetical protein